MSDDSSDESWNASQVPSDLVLTLNKTQDRPLHNVFIPKQQTKQPLTTILKRSQTTRNKKRKKPTKAENASSMQTPLTFAPQKPCGQRVAPLFQPSTSNVEVESKDLVQAKPLSQTMGTLVFADCADMFDVLMHRKELLELCSRALNILVYPCNSFIEGMRFSHSVFHPTGAPNSLETFLRNRPFQIGDDLQHVFVLVWHEACLNVPRIECIANIYHRHPIVVTDALHFSLCVSKRLLQ